MDYQQTVKLPETKFPMRANLPRREPEIQKEWDSRDYYGQLQKLREGASKFILHDGPPYANGHIHLGTALNKVLKDMVIRSHSMAGYHCPYVPGWDTHGLPIEQAVLRSLDVDRHSLSPVEFRRRCREFALQFVEIQREEFKRLGVWGEWDDPYLTLEPEYEARQIEIFGEMARKGYIYKGLKPVYWCAECETALAEAEVEYGDHTSPSIYVKFPLADGKGKIADDGHTYFVIWTTTPWTLPANEAIALHPDFVYVLVDTEEGRLVLAEELLPQVKEEVGLERTEVLQRWKGEELEGITCRHPFLDKTSLVILGAHVTLEQGSGCVHTAPGHGLEDYEVGVKYDLPIFAPVDNKGRFTEEAGKYAGMKLEQANGVIIGDLRKLGLLLKVAEVEHQYPHCWRCKSPIVFRATEQWFASIDGFREAALAAIRQVQWVPEWGIERISNMVSERGDWCISRQRVWGVPIPIFYCQACGEHLINDDTIKAVAELFRREGSDAWFTREAEEILPAGTKCSACGHTSFTKETDIMDVWFDSGSSHGAVLEQRAGLRWPADMYLEGSDQHRGWFQSSLLTAVAVKGTAPYKAVLTHGFIVDGEGRKMSKSLGNTVAPEEIIKKYGADILRLWAASSDYRGDIRLSKEILQQMAEVYRRIRNTMRFILGNIADFDPAKDKVAYEELPEVDRFALIRLYRLIERVTRAYREYEFHIMYHAVHNFCAVDMGGFYLDMLKDRLYCEAPTSRSRRAAQTVIHEILLALVKLIAPVLVHTAEEVWSYLPEQDRDMPSVHLTTWPEVRSELYDAKMEEKWNDFLAIRREVAKALETARVQKVIGSSNDAALVLYPGKYVRQTLEQFDPEELAALFIVSQVELAKPEEVPPAGAWEGMDGELRVAVKAPAGKKCERCWRFSPSVGADAEHSTLCERCARVVREYYAAELSISKES